MSESIIPIGRFIFMNKPISDASPEDNPHGLNRSMIYGFGFSQDKIQDTDVEMWECEIRLKKIKKYTGPEHPLGTASQVLTSEYMWQPDFWENKEF